MHEHLQHLLATHGYWAIAVVVGLESMGIPLPGETILVLASIYAAADPSLNIGTVIAAAVIGSILGDNAGYWIGKRYAFPLLTRFGRHIGMSVARIKVGQYLFRVHGGKVVFFGRFIALLRILAAFLAGVNHMPWRTFLVANAAGAVVWAGAFGVGGFYFGKLLLQLHHTLATGVFIAAIIGFFGIGYLIHRYEERLIGIAEQELPGPLVTLVNRR